MDDESPRQVLDQLIRDRGTTYGALSTLLGRNPAYIQQYVKRGIPRKLDENDRRKLARFLGVEEQRLGGPTTDRRRGAAGVIAVPCLSLGASAGAGALDPDERPAGAIAFSERWLRELGGRPENLSIIRVHGESMVPALSDGDDIMVDGGDGVARLRDGIYVLRIDDALLVKRVAMTPRQTRFSVRSDNPAYPDWEDVDPDSVAIVGRVIWIGRRIA